MAALYSNLIKIHFSGAIEADILPCFLPVDLTLLPVYMSMKNFVETTVYSQLS